MYIIKVKGKGKIPEYIQIRDDQMVLVAYFRADRPFRQLKRHGLEGKETEFADQIKEMSYGKLQRLVI